MVGGAAAIKKSLGLKAVASSFGDLLLPDHQSNLVVEIPSKRGSKLMAFRVLFLAWFCSAAFPSFLVADTNQQKLIEKTVGMAALIADMFDKNFYIVASPNLHETNLCRDDGFCDFSLDGFRVRVYGAGIAEVETNSGKSLNEYRETCAGVFSAISGSDLNLALRLMDDGFLIVSKGQKIKEDINGVEIKIAPDLSDNLACSFFKY
jgi:hypothetical protein